LGLIVLAGCAGSQPQSLSSSAFEPVAPITHFDSPPAQSSPPVAAAPVSTLVVLPAATTEPTTAPAPMQSGQYNTLGGVVADVNGTPIYADALVRLQERILATKAAQMDVDEFRDFAQQSLAEALHGMIEDERYYEIATLHLSDDDKKLVDAIVMRDRQQRIIEAGGSLELAKRRAIAEGTTFDDMMRHDQRSLTWQLFNERMIKPKIQVTAADMRKYYKANVDRLYTEHDQAEFRIIKIDPARIGGDDARAAAMKRITSIRERAENGEDFATLAATENQDDYLKKNAGDPGGWMQRDVYRVDEVDHAVWKLQPGQISPVIEAEDAFYIVKLEAKKPGRVRPFDDPSVQEEVRNILTDQQMTAAKQQQVDDEGLIVRGEDGALLQPALDMAMQEYPRWSKKVPQQ
jgi:parvulin-like peptidyl-prolyl isomerase